MHNQSGEQTVHTDGSLASDRVKNKVPRTYMKAGVYRSSSCAARLSMIAVICAAAWYAIFREGYAESSEA